MATILPSSSLKLPNPFPRAATSTKPHAPLKFTTKANTDSDTNEPSSEPPPPETDDAFEARLNRVRYRSGTGKKAELRKARKSTSKSTSSSSSSSASMYLPPVPLKEPVSALGGTKVDFGFSPYSEKVNGLVAMVGLTALLSVELATGKSLLSFHAPSTLLIQVYFMAAVTSLLVKLEKERASVWPHSSSKK